MNAWTQLGQAEDGDGRPSALRLLCLPFAGGSAAAYKQWGAPGGMPRGVEVWAAELPGRRRRFNEPPFRSIDEAVASLAADAAPLLDRPVALFGHSMGSLLAFELARFFRRSYAVTPVHVFGSGRDAPCASMKPMRIAELSDEQLIDGLKRINGIPAVLLGQPKLLGLFLPTLRADLEMCDAYRHCIEPPLACDITVLDGTRDATTSPSGLAAWADLTAGTCTVHRIEGDHFFVQSQSREVLALVASQLSPVADGQLEVAR